MKTMSKMYKVTKKISKKLGTNLKPIDGSDWKEPYYTEQYFSTKISALNQFNSFLLTLNQCTVPGDTVYMTDENNVLTIESCNATTSTILTIEKWEGFDNEVKIEHQIEYRNSVSEGGNFNENHIIEHYYVRADAYGRLLELLPLEDLVVGDAVFFRYHKEKDKFTTDITVSTLLRVTSWKDIS